MIRYRDKEYKDYFINPYTGIVTDKNGKNIHQSLHKDRCVVKIHNIWMSVQQIQAHTYYGYRPNKVVHHIDGNHHNNVLFNLWYEWTQSQHAYYHNKGKTPSLNTINAIKGKPKSKEQKQKISETLKKYWAKKKP